MTPVTPRIPPIPPLVERFRALVEHRLGLQLEEPTRSALGGVLADRLAATALPCEDYLRGLEHAELDGELGALAEALTIGETYLFRNIEQFRALSEVALPAVIRARRAPVAVRILSAGCASGDEPYSIAIAAREALPAAWPLQIRAVDANRAILARARRARFRAWSLRETPADVQRRYFRAVGRDLVLADAVRDAVSFEQRNLAVDDPELWGPERYDVVFCRNVIMYFSTEVQRQVVERIAQSLTPGGFLFLGHAETLRELSRRFELCHSHGAFYYRRRDGGAAALVRLAPAEPAAPIGRGPAIDLGLAGEGAGTWFDAIRDSADRIAALATANELPSVAGGAGSGAGSGAGASASSGAGSGAGASARSGARFSAPSAAGTGDPVGAAAAAPAVDLIAVIDLMRRERFADALAALEQLPEATDPDAILLHAVLLAHIGRFDAAGEACRQLLASSPAAAVARGSSGLGAGAGGAVTPAMRIAGAHHVLALCRDAAGDRRGAEEHRQAAVYLDPAFAMPRLQLGIAARQAGDRAAARRELGHALVLLDRESPVRLLLFGGGFDRDALIALCRAELAACGAGR